MKKMQDITYHKDMHVIEVYIHGDGVKGARAKGQKFLKLNGIYDGTLWHEVTIPNGKGNTMVFKLTSPSLALKSALQYISHSVKL